jgi:hypothetical protein
MFRGEWYLYITFEWPHERNNLFSFHFGLFTQKKNIFTLLVWKKRKRKEGICMCSTKIRSKRTRKGKQKKISTYGFIIYYINRWIVFHEIIDNCCYTINIDFVVTYKKIHSLIFSPKHWVEFLTIDISIGQQVW